MSRKNDIEYLEHVMALFDKYKNFLTQTQKQAIQLYFMEDLSFGEVAEIVATSRQAINDAVKKGIKKMEKIDKKLSE